MSPLLGLGRKQKNFQTISISHISLSFLLISKTLPDGTAHTYIAYIREYPGGFSYS